MALLDLLGNELVRIGRQGMMVTLRPDGRTVVLEDIDGRWEGSLPVAYAVMTYEQDWAMTYEHDGAMTYEYDKALGDQFWQRIALRSAAS